MLVSPFLEPVKTQFWYALSFLLAGVVLYVPFVVLKLRFPGMGKFSSIRRNFFHIFIAHFKKYIRYEIITKGNRIETREHDNDCQTSSVVAAVWRYRLEIQQNDMVCLSKQSDINITLINIDESIEILGLVFIIYEKSKPGENS